MDDCLPSERTCSLVSVVAPQTLLWTVHDTWGYEPPAARGGMGAHLLSHLRKLTPATIWIGTWSDAVWPIRFYEEHGFQIVRPEHYWSIPERQIKASVVLRDSKWRELHSNSEEVG